MKAKSNIASSSRIQRRDSSEDSNTIIDRFCEQLDELALKQEVNHNELLKQLRQDNPDIANEIEKAFANLRQDKQYGTPLAAYIKSEILRPLQRKFKDGRP